MFDGVARSLPALAYAQHLARKAAKVGFDWPDVDGPLAKVDEEVAELREAIAGGDAARIADELGDVAIAPVNVARHAGTDAELAVRRGRPSSAAASRASRRSPPARAIDLRPPTWRRSTPCGTRSRPPSDAQPRGGSGATLARRRPAAGVDGQLGAGAMWTRSTTAATTIAAPGRRRFLRRQRRHIERHARRAPRCRRRSRWMRLRRSASDARPRRRCTRIASDDVDLHVSVLDELLSRRTTTVVSTDDGHGLGVGLARPDDPSTTFLTVPTTTAYGRGERHSIHSPRYGPTTARRPGRPHRRIRIEQRISRRSVNPDLRRRRTSQVATASIDAPLSLADHVADRTPSAPVAEVDHCGTVQRQPEDRLQRGLAYRTIRDGRRRSAAAPAAQPRTASAEVAVPPTQQHRRAVGDRGHLLTPPGPALAAASLASHGAPDRRHRHPPDHRPDPAITAMEMATLAGLAPGTDDRRALPRRGGVDGRDGRPPGVAADGAGGGAWSSCNGCW